MEFTTVENMERSSHDFSDFDCNACCSKTGDEFCVWLVGIDFADDFADGGD